MMVSSTNALSVILRSGSQSMILMECAINAVLTSKKLKDELIYTDEEYQGESGILAQEDSPLEG